MQVGLVVAAVVVVDAVRQVPLEGVGRSAPLLLLLLLGLDLRLGQAGGARRTGGGHVGPGDVHLRQRLARRPRQVRLVLLGVRGEGGGERGELDTRGGLECGYRAWVV